MYPNLYYLFQDLFGLEIPFLQLFQSFGFMVAISFVLANITMVMELKRHEKSGLLQSKKVRISPETQKKQREGDFYSAIVVGFLLGFKIIGVFSFPDAFSDVQSYFLSAQGNIITGVLAAAALGGYRYWKNKQLPAIDGDKVEEVHPYQHMGNITIMAALFGLLGAKLFHNLENWNDFIADPIGQLISFSGLTFYGGLIFGAVTVLYLGRKHSIPYKMMLDAGGPALMLAYGVGRIGCHISGDGDWGINNLADKPGWLSWAPDWMWSYNYPHNVINQGVLMENCQGNYCYQLGVPVYPTPFYEAIICVTLFFVLWSLRKRIKIPGILFSIYLMLNGAERFLIEKIRVNNKMDFLGMELTQAEIISFSLILLGLVSLLYFYKDKPKEA
ncbi:MAG: diacylglyceryl transferase [Bacteroidetes bacterium]|nr:MAG: diacylglyceryl transferase [Bacteroidota bacterium]